MQNKKQSRKYFKTYIKIKYRS